MDAALLDELTGVAHQLADAAARETLPLFRTALRADSKDEFGFDPVTEADRASERAMRAVLARLRPEDGILGEEEGAREGTSGLTWTLDPIDGTRAFLAGAPSWGTLIACGPSDAAPFIGIVDQPYIGERFVGTPDGAWLKRGEARAIRTREVQGLGEAILFTTFPEVGTAAERECFRAVADRVRLTRYGMDCYAYALVALGQCDLVIEAGLQPYDIRAPMALVEAAGGIVTDWRGGPAEMGGRVIAAGCATVHAAALELLQGIED